MKYTRVFIFHKDNCKPNKSPRMESILPTEPPVITFSLQRWIQVLMKECSFTSIVLRIVLKLKAGGHAQSVPARCPWFPASAFLFPQGGTWGLLARALFGEGIMKGCPTKHQPCFLQDLAWTSWTSGYFG